MEAKLVDIFRKIFQPDIQKSLTFEIEFNIVGSFFEDSNSWFFECFWFLLVNIEFLFKDDLEFEVELKLSSKEVLSELKLMGANSQVKVSHRNPDLLRLTFV